MPQNERINANSAAITIEMHLFWLKFDIVSNANSWALHFFAIFCDEYNVKRPGTPAVSDFMSQKVE